MKLPAACSITCAEREQRLLVERPPDQLQAERQALRVEPRRHRNPRQAGHVHRHREHVVQIHLDRIGAALLAQAEGGRRRRRRQHGVHALAKQSSKSRLISVRTFCARR